MNQIDPKALFRLSVLGPLVSREQLARGELRQLSRELSAREYAIPGTQRRHIGEKTIQAWYYAWRRLGLAGLGPKPRADRGRSKISNAVQEAILAAKRDNPRRSVRQIVRLLEAAGTVASASLSRSAVHRLLQQSGLSRLAGSASQPEEKRSFAAEFAGSVWYGDVMHGPRVSIKGAVRKTYLVSLIDDASRLVAHSAFCLGETALDVEGVLKQALLRRGVPIKLVVDNGAAYRANTLQGICARLGIHLIFCRPYAPEGKGKLERWHRTLRDQFLSELDERRIADLDDLNARLWAWLEQIYHRTAHAGLGGLTPLARYQRDLPRIRSLGAKAVALDALFHHRTNRLVWSGRTARCRTWASASRCPTSCRARRSGWSWIRTPSASWGSRTRPATHSARPRRWTRLPTSGARGASPIRPRPRASAPGPTWWRSRTRSITQ
jgi:putative transposase